MIDGFASVPFRELRKLLLLGNCWKVLESVRFMGYIVLFYSDYQSVYGGNLISSLKALEARIVADGGRVVWTIPQQAGECSWCRDLMAGGHDVVLRPALGALGSVRWLRDLVEERNIDIVHIHLAGIVIPAVVGWSIPSLKVIQQVHSDWSLGRGDSTAARVKAAPKRLLASRVAQIAVSRELGAKLGCPYVENGIDLTRVHGLYDSEREKIRQGYGICDDATLVMVYAWSPVVKGLDVACAAVGRLREHGLDFHLGVVCAEDVEQTKRWVERNTSVPADAPWLHFLPPVEDVFDYHAIADIVLSASRSEGFSYVLCEAILAGKPCVASDIPGTKWSAEFKTVDFFESEDCAACADALAACDSRRSEGGFDDALRASAEECAEKYNTSRWADEVYALYGDAGRKRRHS